MNLNGCEPDFDMRESRSGIFHRLDELKLPYTKQMRKIGDVGIQHIAAIEIKRQYPKDTDLTDSIKDGRLFKELQKQRDHFLFSYLIIEGDPSFIKSSVANLDPRQPPNHDRLKNLIFSCNVDFNTHVLFSKNIDNTIDLIYSIAERYINGLRDESERRDISKNNDHLSQAVLFYQGLPNVGLVSAKKFSAVFDRVIDCINHFVGRHYMTSINSIEGFAYKSNEKIRKFLTKNYRNEK